MVKDLAMVKCIISGYTLGEVYWLLCKYFVSNDQEQLKLAIMGGKSGDYI